MRRIPRARRERIRGRAASTLLVLLLGCAGDSAGPDGPHLKPATRIVVSILVETLRPGEATRAIAVGRDDAGAVATLADPAWSSSNPAVAIVEPINGIVTAVGIGTATIVATAGGLRGEVLLRVVPVPVEALSVLPAHIRIAPGESTTLAAVVIDAAGRLLRDRTVLWVSSDPARATVSSMGVVTGIAPGSLTVTAVSEGVYASSEVRVSGPPGPIATVTLSPAAASLSLADTIRLASLLEDRDGNIATDRPVRWTSSAPTVASVSQAGLVTALTAGTAIIEAESEGRRGAATIKVFDPADVITVTIADPAPDEVVGDTLRVYVSAYPMFRAIRGHARAASKDVNLVKVPAGSQGKSEAWEGRIPLTEVRYGPYELVVTITDARGIEGIASVIFKRGTREGEGGAKVPSKNR